MRFDDYLYAVRRFEKLEASKKVQDYPFGELLNYVQESVDDLTTRAAQAAFEMKVAELIAKAEPGDPQTEEAREEKAHSLVTSDSFGLAWGALMELHDIERYTVLAALENARASVEGRRPEVPSSRA
jgi:hypothetical protein